MKANDELPAAQFREIRLKEIRECVNWRKAQDQGVLVSQLNRDIEYLLDYIADKEIPPTGTNVLCLICASQKPWGIFHAPSGVSVCIECRDKARATPSVSPSGINELEIPPRIVVHGIEYVRVAPSVDAEEIARNIWEKWIPFGFKNAPDDYYYTQKEHVIQETAAALRDRPDGYRQGIEDAARVADAWAQSHSCANHDDNPCCHVRTGAGIRDAIRALVPPEEVTK